LGLKKGITPHQTTLHRVLRRLDAKQVEEAFRHIFHLLAETSAQERGTSALAIDGKAQRGRLKFEEEDEYKVHAMSICEHQTGIVLIQGHIAPSHKKEEEKEEGQQKEEEKKEKSREEEEENNKIKGKQKRKKTAKQAEAEKSSKRTRIDPIWEGMDACDGRLGRCSSCPLFFSSMISVEEPTFQVWGDVTYISVFLCQNTFLVEVVGIATTGYLL
jgi:hypothetical protein